MNNAFTPNDREKEYTETIHILCVWLFNMAQESVRLVRQQNIDVVEDSLIRYSIKIRQTQALLFLQAALLPCG